MDNSGRLLYILSLFNTFHSCVMVLEIFTSEHSKFNSSMCLNDRVTRLNQYTSTTHPLGFVCTRSHISKIRAQSSVVFNSSVAFSTNQTMLGD